MDCTMHRSGIFDRLYGMIFLFLQQRQQAARKIEKSSFSCIEMGLFIASHTHTHNALPFYPYNLWHFTMSSGGYIIIFRSHYANSICRYNRKIYGYERSGKIYLNGKKCENSLQFIEWRVNVSLKSTATRNCVE